MQSREHWEHVYSSGPAESDNWFQEHADTSLKLITAIVLDPAEHIIDVGGGDSTLVDDLLARGFSNVTVLDIPASALQKKRARLGSTAAHVTWITGDIIRVELPGGRYDVWHDRALFHFLVNAEDRAAYMRRLKRSLKVGGHLILATFAEDGPTRCSGLPVMCYSVEDLRQEPGQEFEFILSERIKHVTPSGLVQDFNYCLFYRSH
jgi:ubiquinone/menaquinone biosynthesis C-methylase UbiE